MLFNSFGFVLCFLPVTLTGYFLIGRRSVRASNIWLLAASFFFYGCWDWRFVPLLFASIVWNYFFGTRLLSSRHRKLMLFIAIAGNLSLLGYFKYKDFFVHAMSILTFAANTDWDPSAAILPLGISFWTFTQTAFLIDAYRGKACTKDGCSFWDYSLFVMIFPHLISGPIINHAKMIPQFNDEGRHRANWNNIASGLALFSLGLFKKVVVADGLATIVGSVFENSKVLPLLDTWTGLIAYTLQLYFDFSGYSEMAVGLGEMLNIEFSVNFDSPYKSSSPIEFWRHWHITLGGWIRDYLYIPLGGNRKGLVRKMLNLFVCMTLCGFWHGAGFTFIGWGMYHGMLVVVNHSWRELTKRHPVALPKALCVPMTFICTVFGWAVFRAGDIPKLIKIMKGLFNKELTGGGVFALGLSNPSGRNVLVILVLLLLVFFAPNAIQLWKAKFKPNLRWAIVMAVISIASLICFSRNSPFLYFDF